MDIHRYMRPIDVIREKMLHIYTSKELVSGHKITNWDFTDYGNKYATVCAEFLFDDGNFIVRFRQNEFVLGKNSTLYVISEFLYTVHNFEEQKNRHDALINELVHGKLKDELIGAQINRKIGENNLDYFISMNQAVELQKNPSIIKDALTYLKWGHDLLYYKEWQKDPSEVVSKSFIVGITLSINDFEVTFKYFGIESFKLGQELINKYLKKEHYEGRSGWSVKSDFGQKRGYPSSPYDYDKDNPYPF